MIYWESQAKGEGTTHLTDRVPTSPSTGIRPLLLAQGVQCCSELGLCFPEPQTQSLRELSKVLDSGAYFLSQEWSHTCPVEACGVNFSVSCFGNRQLEACQKLKGMIYGPTSFGCGAAGG